MTSVVTHYRFHGTGITISGDDAVSAALHSRLKMFSAERLQDGSMHFEYRSVPAPEAHIVMRPSGLGRTVTESGRVETVYFENSDQLYIDYAGRVRVLCDTRQWHVRLSIQEPADQNLWLLSHPAFTLPLAEMLKRRGFYGLHAAGLCTDGKVILFAGDSGAGKSTLTVALLRKGFDYMADDMVFLRKDPEGLKVMAFPDEIDLTDETIARFPELGQLARLPKSQGWRKRQVRPEEIYPVKTVLECRPSLLIFPRVSGNSNSFLRPMDRSEALLGLLSNIIRTDPESSQNHLDALTALVKESNCYSLETGSDVDVLPELFRKVLASP
jgi:hypothetical protein